MSKLLAFLIVLSSVGICQQPKPSSLTDQQLLDLRASIPKMVFDPSAKVEQRVMLAFKFCEQLGQNRLQADYAAAIFCSQLDSEFRLKIPAE